VSLLFFWSLVVWGTLLLVATGWGALGDGLRPAVDRLLPSPQATLLDWFNALSAALAVAVWAAVALAVFWLRRAGPRESEPPTGP
jgi:hypothetical protein